MRCQRQMRALVNKTQQYKTKSALLSSSGAWSIPFPHAEEFEENVKRTTKDGRGITERDYHQRQHARRQIGIE